MSIEEKLGENGKKIVSLLGLGLWGIGALSCFYGAYLGFNEYFAIDKRGNLTKEITSVKEYGKISLPDKKIYLDR